MIRSVIYLLTVSLLLAITTRTWAGHGCGQSDDCCCQVECPQCHHVCKVSVDKVKEEDYCWEVDCKPICIPRVHFPWECACPPKCAKIKYVNVLTKKTQECEVCKYTWTPTETCCGGGCEGGCANECDSAFETVAPTAARIQPADQAPSLPTSTDLLAAKRPTWIRSAKDAARSTAAFPARFFAR